ncbi:MAG TPA: YojF family protein [Paenibacillaceae bacterium]
MRPIDPKDVQARIDRLKGQDLYLHIEMTTGAYAAYYDETKHQASAFVKNGRIRFSRGSVAGWGPYRVGLKTDEGWVYAEGLTHYEDEETERLIMAGHDRDGKLVVALQLSPHPF